MKILVGFSGGVDSSVAALLLKEQGHDVVGVNMSIWGKDDSFLPLEGVCKDACYGPGENARIEFARKVAEEIGIPFHVIDCVSQYEEVVLENFKEEYLLGRTPNPCIRCNSKIKFDALISGAKQFGLEFDKFATGHYAQVFYDEMLQRYGIKKGINPKKDQSYFIYRLRQDQLEKIIFPLGGYTKEEIRKIAQDKNLSIHNKPDSQDFYGSDYSKLLGMEEKQGNIVDKNGKILGKHKGIWNYTVGQRKGIGIAAPRPLYVLALEKEKNEVIVGEEDDTFKKALVAKNLNWVSIAGLTEEIKATAKIRSAQTPVDVVVRPQGDDIYVEFLDLQKSITLGQSIVLYNDDILLGGGIIEEIL